MISEISDILLEPSDVIVAVASQPCSETIFIGFADGALKAYVRNESGSLVKDSKLQQNTHLSQSKIFSLQAHPFLPNLLVAGLAGGAIIVWDAQNGRVARRDDLLASDVVQIRWLGHGRILVIGDAVGRVVVSAFDPLSSELKTLQKVQRNGKIIAIQERTACTRNFYLNAPPVEDCDRIYPHIETGPLEILVAWDRGDVINIHDTNKVSVVVSLQQGIQNLLYLPECDMGCAISAAGDLVGFGFESPGWRAKKMILGKTKLEYMVSGGMCAIGGAKIAYVGSTGSQIKVFDLLKQQAIVIDLDDTVEEFKQVTGDIQFVQGLGLLIPTKLQGQIVIVSDKNLARMVSKFSFNESNQNYVNLMDQSIKQVIPQDLELQVRQILKCDAENNDCYLTRVMDEGELNVKQNFMVSNKKGESGASYSIITFKKPVICESNLMNQQILAQQLSNESLQNADFLDRKLFEARNYSMTAVQTSATQIKVFINTSKNLKEDYIIGVNHRIEKMQITQILGASKNAYLLVYGDNKFSTFEVGEALLPVAVDSFTLPDYQVNDCILFGRYIIAAVEQKLGGMEQEFTKCELLKLTFAGKVSQTMPINYSADDKNLTSVRVNKLLIINQHLLMISPNGTLFYGDLKNFARYVQVAKLRADYLFNESTQIKTKAEKEGSEGPIMSVMTAISQTFNVGSVFIKNISGSLSLDAANIIVLAMTFAGFNEILQMNIELPCVMTVQLNATELVQLLGSNQQNQDANYVQQYRVFDFAPNRVSSAFIDPIGNMVVDVEQNEVYKYLLLQFSSFVSSRFGFWSKAHIQHEGGQILKDFIEQEKEFADEEDVGNVEMEGIPMATFMKFLNIRVTQEVRQQVVNKQPIFGIRRAAVIVQGLFAPFTVPKIETQQIESCGLVVGVASPAIIVLALPKPELKTLQECVMIQHSSISSLYVGSEPLTQSPKTSYTLTKFIISVENNRFDDAYSFVSQSDSVEIWRSLASLCIKNGYVELLKTCVSHLKSPIISLLLRSMNSSASHESKLENQISKNQELAAVLSIALSEVDSGIQMVSNKPILHSKMMQQSGLVTFTLMEDAQRQTLGFNSITRKSNVYVLANRLYGLGDYTGANACYSELFSGKDVFSQKDQQLKKQNETDTKQVIDAYNGAQANLVAVSQLAKKLNSKPALFEAAKIFEKESEKSTQVNQRRTYQFEAAKLFKLAGTTTHAMTCALACENDDLIYNIGSTSNNVRLSLLAAGYFAQRINQTTTGDQSCLEKALILYGCSGYSGQAVELCLQTGKLKELSGLLNDVIGTKSQDLSSTTHNSDNQNTDQKQSGESKIEQSKQKLKKSNISAELLTKAGQTLISVKQEDVTLDEYSTFVKIGLLALAHAKAVDQALYCINQGVITINEEIADLLTPEDIKTEDAQAIVLTIGKLLFKAELYQAAVKKFIQINNSYLALQSLIKLGDTTKIVKFAQMSRSKECFVAAANYLQTQNFRDDGQLMTLIIQFYSKAAANEHLVKFFVNCAKEEIDVFNDYEKAIDALREAAKWIGKTVAASEDKQKIEKLEIEKKDIEANAKLINGFLHLIEYARNNLNGVDAAEVLGNNSKKLLQAVVQQENCYVQVPHILAFLCEFHAQRGEQARVVQILQQMQAKEIDLRKYVDAGVLKEYGPHIGIEVPEQQDTGVEIDLNQNQMEDDQPINDDLNIDL